MTDVLLYQTNDNGEINIEDGSVEMSGGLETAAYLSLFGGNKDDSTVAGDARTWWGNLDETETSRRYRSEMQYLIGTLPATSYNLGRIEDAAKRDLQWFLDEAMASSVSVSASLVDLNHVKIEIIIRADGELTEFSYTVNWGAST